MQTQTIGQILSTMVPLSSQDVEEILCEQAFTGQRFGEIAIAWGLCNTEQVLRAWSKQMADRREPVNLIDIGVDAQAVAYLPYELAAYFRAIPVRVLSDLLIVAVADWEAVPALTEFLKPVREELRFVLADDRAIENNIMAYYDATAIAA